MQFLNPFVLAGLLAAAVPIVLHFLSRRRVIEIPFAPLRFLRPTQERQMRRMSLRRLLLLILRVAIVTLVVLAFARPTLTGGLASLVRGGESVSVVILVDDSASMQAQGEDGSAFERARAEASALAASLDRDDEVLVALFDTEVEPLLAEFVRRPAIVTAELAEAAAGTGGTDYLAAVERGLELLQRGRGTHREIHLIGDLQATVIDSTRLLRLRDDLSRQPPTAIYLRPVRTEPFVNRRVGPVERPAELLRANETADIAVRVRQDGTEPVSVPLFLEVEGTTVGETEVELVPDGTVRHVFPLTLPEVGDLGASVRVRPDRYPLDDEYFFVLTVSEQVPVLVLRGVTGEGGERDALLFLGAALDPEQGEEGRFAPTIEPAEGFDPRALDRVPVVVAVDPRDLGAARTAAMTDYLKQGGTLLIFAGDPRVGSYLDQRLLSAWTPLRLGSFRGHEDVFERLEIVARDHPVFDGLEEEALATLEETRLRNFYRISEGAGRTLVRYAGGGSAIVEFEVGQGHVILCGFDTAATGGDLPWSPMFLPLVQRLTGYLATAGWGRFGRQFGAGDEVGVQAPAEATAATAFTRIAPDGTEHPAQLDASVLPARVRAGRVGTPGIHRFAADGEVFAKVAVNVPRAESERRFWSPAEMSEALGGDAGAVHWSALEGESIAQALTDARVGKGIHRWFLMLAGLLLVVEGLVARRVGR